MVKQKTGFTLIEVTIFLAISGLLFIGVTAGVNLSLTQQKNTDSAQNFMEFLRGVYAQVTSVQIPGRGGDVSEVTGRSDRAVYGKLVTFGEKWNIWKRSDGSLVPNDDGSLFVYTVTGKAEGSTKRGTLDMLADLETNIVEDDGGGLVYSGIVEKYTPKWGAEVQPACTQFESGTGRCIGEFVPLEGALLIVRNPETGYISTYFRNKALQTRDELSGSIKDNLFRSGDENYNLFNGLSVPEDEKFKLQQVDFCLNVAGNPSAVTTDRFNIRLIEGANNASAVELVPDNNAAGVEDALNRLEEGASEDVREAVIAKTRNRCLGNR